MLSWLEGRNLVGKCAQATGMTASLRYCQAKPIQTLGRASQGVNWSWSQCIKSHHAQTSSGKGLPSHFWNRNIVRSILPGLRRKRRLAQWSKVLFSDESKFSISFGNQGPRVWRKSGEAQNPCCLKSSVKFPQSVMIWAAMSSAGVGPLCFMKSTVNAAINQEILEHLILPSVDKLYGDPDFIFQQDLAPAHTAKGTKSWFNDHVLLCWLASKLAWPEPHWESMESTPDPTMQMTWRQLSKQPGLPLHPSSATGWLPPCHAALMQ